MGHGIGGDGTTHRALRTTGDIERCRQAKRTHILRSSEIKKV